MRGKPIEGYARYIKLVDLFITKKKFASSSTAAGHKLSWLFANALHALTACIAHEEIPDVSPLAAALERAVAACSASKPPMYDGLVISAFGLGLHAWLARDRKKAADYYVSGVAAAEAAAAARVKLCDWAVNKAAGCADNLAVLRGEVRLKPSPMNARREFFSTDVESILAGRPELPKIAKSLCGEPSCAKDMAAMKCGRCQSVRYCNATCQRAHWAEHKKVCQAAALD